MIIRNIGNNKINIPDSNRVRIIVEGNNNTINVSPDTPKDTDIDVKIYGDDNFVDIGKILGQLRVDMGYNDDRKICNAKFVCGDNRMNGVNTFSLEDNTSITIGKNCRFSSGIYITNSDQHCMLDENRNVTNCAKSIVIGDGCWIAKDVTILKNTEIADGCAIGTKAVVSGKFLKPNCLIVGNPARVIRENILLDTMRPDWYLKKHPNNKPIVKKEYFFKTESYRLFGCIKLFKVKTSKHKKIIYILGMPIFTANDEQ